jgi:hypothetical protein
LLIGFWDLLSSVDEFGFKRIGNLASIHGIIYAVQEVYTPQPSLCLIEEKNNA